MAVAEATAEIIVLVEGTWRFRRNMIFFFFGGKDLILKGFGKWGFGGFVCSRRFRLSEKMLWWWVL